MQQAGADHFVLAKFRRNVLKEGVAVGYRYGLGGLHHPIEIVVGQSQSQLVERGAYPRLRGTREAPWRHSRRTGMKNWHNEK